MKIYDMDGNEMRSVDCDPKVGRLLQDPNDPEKYVFSPWTTVPLREEENPPQETDEQKINDIEAALIELANLIEG